MTKLSVSYVCKYAPVELIAGFGIKAKPIEYEEKEPAQLETLIHPSICGYAKNILGAVCAKKVTGLILTTCCDAMKRVADVCEADNLLDFLYVIDLPHKNGPSANKRYTKELKRLASKLKHCTGNDFDLSRALGALLAPESSPESEVVLMGAHTMPSLLDLAERELGCSVLNLTCSGVRNLGAIPDSLLHKRDKACEQQAQQDLDRFLAWYTPALLAQDPCMRMEDISARSHSSTQPILYHTLRFCEYWPFEYATLSKNTQAPLLKIETEATAGSAEQLITRLGAFKERMQQTNPLKGERMRYAIGIDIGSTTSKGVLVDRDSETIVARAIRPTGAQVNESAQNLLAELSAHIPKGAQASITATGYGRDALSEQGKTITEITCHARGAQALMPDVACVIDIGGQDSKVISLDEMGQVAGFVMNDKCAAGTGRFLDTMARVLELDQDAFAQAGVSAKKPASISSMCTVFAESEVVSLIAQNTSTKDIVSGLAKSVAQKTASLVARTHGKAPYLFTGGVSKNASVVEALTNEMNEHIATHKDSQFCGALGAALLG